MASAARLLAVLALLLALVAPSTFLGHAHPAGIAVAGDVVPDDAGPGHAHHAAHCHCAAPTMPEAVRVQAEPRPEATVRLAFAHDARPPAIGPVLPTEPPRA